jgi:PIN domain nuclease of toxin-antitoxin system
MPIALLTSFVDRISFIKECAIQSGLLYTITHAAGLSFGDRACLTLDRNLNAVAVTADRAWQDLDLDVQVHLTRP